jgi:hypothetical protein
MTVKGAAFGDQNMPVSLFWAHIPSFKKKGAVRPQCKKNKK